jgi:hypothetical protein
LEYLIKLEITGFNFNPFNFSNKGKMSQLDVSEIKRLIAEKNATSIEEQKN